MLTRSTMALHPLEEGKRGAGVAALARARGVLAQKPFRNPLKDVDPHDQAIVILSSAMVSSQTNRRGSTSSGTPCVQSQGLAEAWQQTCAELLPNQTQPGDS